MWFDLFDLTSFTFIGLDAGIRGLESQSFIL